MDPFDEQKSNNSAAPEGEVDNVVDMAIARMKTGAVVKEERRRRVKFAVITASVVAGLAAFSTLDFVYQTPVSETAANGDIVITLKQDHSGHFLAKGEINGEPVKFIVDTGATNVAIPLSVAKRIGLPLGRELTTVTANGFGTAYETGLKSISLGEITLTGVSASVSEGLTGEEALLGMSFLGRTRIEQESGVMKIIY